MDTLKEWTRFKFDFLEQVEGDLDLPPSAFKVAFRILQHCNMKLESGFAGIAHIASKTGLRKETVLDAVRRLVANGHFEIDPGQPGRGHSHIYTPILKGPETGPIVAEEKVRKPDLSVTRDVTNKRSGFSSEKVRFSEIKGPVFRGKGPETGPEHLLTPSGTPSLNTVRSGTAPASENDREKGDRGERSPTRAQGSGGQSSGESGSRGENVIPIALSSTQSKPPAPPGRASKPSTRPAADCQRIGNRPAVTPNSPRRFSGTAVPASRSTNSVTTIARFRDHAALASTGQRPGGTGFARPLSEKAYPQNCPLNGCRHHEEKERRLAGLRERPDHRGGGGTPGGRD